MRPCAPEPPPEMDGRAQADRRRHCGSAPAAPGRARERPLDDDHGQRPPMVARAIVQLPDTAPSRPRPCAETRSHSAVRRSFSPRRRARTPDRSRRRCRAVAQTAASEAERDPVGAALARRDPLGGDAGDLHGALADPIAAAAPATYGPALRAPRRPLGADARSTGAAATNSTTARTVIASSTTHPRRARSVEAAAGCVTDAGGTGRGEPDGRGAVGEGRTAAGGATVRRAALACCACARRWRRTRARRARRARARVTRSTRATLRRNARRVVRPTTPSTRRPWRDW